MNTDFKKMTAQQRMDYLQTHSDKIEEGEYFISYGEEEMAQVQADLANAAMTLASKSAAFELAKAEHKRTIAPFKKDYETALSNLRHQGETTTGKLYLFADHDNKVMNFYDVHGDLIKSRRLRPDERQMTILNSATKIA